MSNEEAKQAQAVEPAGYWLERAKELVEIFEDAPSFSEVATKINITQPLSTERAGLINTPEKVRKFFSSNFETLHYGRDDQAPDEADKYTMSAHDIISAFDWSADMLEADVSLINEGNKVQQVSANQGCQYPMCHSEDYQQAVTAQITAELWTGVVVPAGFVLVPIEPTDAMLEAGRDTPCTADAHDDEDIKKDYCKVYQGMLAAAPQPPQGDKHAFKMD